MTRRFFTLLSIALSAAILAGVTAMPVHAQDEDTVNLTVETVTFDPRTGMITVTGTVTCMEPGTLINVSVVVVQPGADGGGTAFVECGSGDLPFSVTFAAFGRGRFHPGPTRLYVSAGLCTVEGDAIDCIIVDDMEGRLRLLPR